MPKCKTTMKLNRKTVVWGLLATLLLASTCGFALTLGRVRGAAIVGKPLDVSVAVQSSADDDLSAACIDADVYFGDTPLERSRVNISVQPGAQPDSRLVRLTSDASVDEPLVRLVLRTVCNTKTSRTYVLLSDVLSDTAMPASASVASPAVTQAERPAIAPAAATVVAKEGAVKSTSKVHPALKLVPATPGAGAAVAAKTGRAANLSATAMEDLQRRVDEIAKWQANSNLAEDVQKSEARAKAMEADIKGLQAVAAKNQQSIEMVAAAVESNSSQNHVTAIAYALGAVLLMCLAGLVYVATRKGASGLGAAPWWSGQEDRANTPPASVATSGRASAHAPLVAAESRPAKLQPTPVVEQEASPTATSHPVVTLPVASSAAADASASADISSIAAFNNLSASRARTGARQDFSHSGPGNLKSINTREMLDVRQQAEFFMALGQHDEAVRLLESNIKGSNDYNPLVFLDLLKIFHTLGRRTEFESYREEFNAQFTGRIPSYADFLLEGNGLDAYEDICEQIVVLWPSEYTVDFIEQCLVRLPEDDPEQGIDLEAFRDLLLLYGVLKRLDQGYDSNLAAFSTSRAEPTQNSSINAALGAATAPLPVDPSNQGSVTTPMDIDLDLDLDLSEAPPKLAPHDNLIDFDVSAYMVSKNPDPSK